MSARTAVPARADAISIKDRFHLAFSRLFTYLTPSQADALLSRANLIACEAGEFIVYEGAACKALYVIVDGEAKVLKREYTQRHHEKMVELAVLGLGSIVGEMSFLDGDVASASVMAERATKLYRIDRDVIFELIGQSPDFSANFYRSLAGILSRRLRLANTILTTARDVRAIVGTASYRIFVVDDDPDVLKFITLFLEHAGHSVRSCTSAMEGLTQVRQFRPDLVMTDLMMPGLNGLDFCRELRRQDEFTAVKVVMMSARPEAYWAAESLDAGADGFIMKPLNPETIVSQVARVMAGNRATRAA